MRLKLRTQLWIALFAAASLLLGQKLRELKPSDSVKNIPIEEDIKIGQQAAQEVPKQMRVVDNAQVQPFLDRVIKNLTSQSEAGQYPYSIRIVYDPSINAFAFPGGSMFIHTGLIQQAENEDQVAGVLAHEISHVALRHGVANMVRAQKTQTVAGIGAMIAGIFLGNGMAGQLAQMGIGFGANSMMLKNSRDAEQQADLLGARMMNSAGYNPIEMARFFEKLEAESGGGGRGSAFFSDHPNPGNRVQYVEEEIQMLPRHQYNSANSADFQKARSAVNTIKAPPKPTGKPGSAGSAGGNTGQVGQGSNGMKRYQGQGFAMDFPQGWDVYGGQQDNVTLAPKNGIKQGQNGQSQIGLGVIVSAVASQGDLNQGTQSLIQNLRQQNPSMQVGGNRGMTVGGAPGMLTTMKSQSAFGGTEVDYLLTAQLNNRLFYAVFITQEQNVQKVQNAFQQMIQSIQFAQ